MMFKLRNLLKSNSLLNLSKRSSNGLLFAIPKFKCPLLKICFSKFSLLLFLKENVFMKKQLLSLLSITLLLSANAQTTIVDVTNPITGATWMDRNLGATQVATSETDVDAYGYYFQWGRGADGHEIPTSMTTTTLSMDEIPGHGSFIVNPNAPYNWISSQINTLWQGVNGVNNVCPTGYRIPTNAEFDAERLTWGSQDAIGAFNSVLKLPLSGYRSVENGTFIVIGEVGYYYSSDLDVSGGTNYLAFNSSVAGIYSSNRGHGMSVRCIKDASASISENASISFSFFPNPATSIVTIQSDYTIESVSIYSLSGTLIQTETSDSFSVKTLSSGIYLIKIQTPNGVATQRFVKE